MQSGTGVEVSDEPVEPALRCNEVLRGLLEREGERFRIDFGHRDRGYGTTDLAYVGQHAPTLMFRLATWPEGTPAHSAAAVAASRLPESLDGMLVAAKLLARMTIDLLTDDGLVRRAAAEFAAPAPASAADQAVAEF